MTYDIFKIAVIVLAGTLLLLGIVNRIGDRRRYREAKKRVVEVQGLLAAGDLSAARAINADLADFYTWHQSMKLPAIVLHPDRSRPVASGGTRLGGPVWFPYDEDWPRSRAGGPLVFIAQLDFSELPPLPDFPDSGLLQFFIDGDYSQAPDGPFFEALLIWRSGGVSANGLKIPLPVSDGIPDNRRRRHDNGPFEDAEAQTQGIGLRAQSVWQVPRSMDWQVETRFQSLQNGHESDDLEIYLETIEEIPRVHHCGGYPEFTQGDVRDAINHGEYDRVLLRLTSDEIIAWGDGGEAVFMIPRADLLTRNFSRVIFTWDCH